MLQKSHTMIGGRLALIATKLHRSAWPWPFLVSTTSHTDSKTVSGIDTVTGVSIAGEGSPEFRIDGNKRTAFVAMELFLALNGATLNASDADCVLMMLSLAAGGLDEAATVAWIRERNGLR